jgi:adenylate kinase family enzyme
LINALRSLAGVRRVSVVGNSGSGKSRLARALAAQLGAPHVELDAIFHQQNWAPLPVAEFRARVAMSVAAETWVVDGNYRSAQDLVWARADTVVWLDPPRRVVMRQILRRSCRRLLCREELWNGNRENLRNLLTRDPGRNIVLWAWREHAKYHRRHSRAARDPAYSHLTFVRLGSPREARRFLDQLAAEPRT